MKPDAKCEMKNHMIKNSRKARGKKLEMGVKFWFSVIIRVCVNCLVESRCDHRPRPRPRPKLQAPSIQSQFVEDKVFSSITSFPISSSTANCSFSVRFFITQKSLDWNLIKSCKFVCWVCLKDWRESVLAGTFSCLILEILARIWGGVIWEWWGCAKYIPKC